MSNIPLKIFQSLLNNTLAYFTITSAVWWFVYLVPSVLALSGASLYFSLLGIIGLSSYLLFPITIIQYAMTSENFKNNVPTSIIYSLIIAGFVMVPIGLSIQVSVPFFISILCGVSPFISTSLLSLSAVNISILVSCAYNFLASLPAICFVSSVCNPVNGDQIPLGKINFSNNNGEGTRLLINNTELSQLFPVAG